METGVIAQIFGPDGLVVVAALIVVLLFGGRKLPELARSLGSASHQFKKGAAEGEAGAGSNVEALSPPRSSAG